MYFEEAGQRIELCIGLHQPDFRSRKEVVGTGHGEALQEVGTGKEKLQNVTLYSYETLQKKVLNFLCGHSFQS